MGVGVVDWGVGVLPREGAGAGPTTPVTSHDPRHVAAAVPWYHCGSDGHGASSSGLIVEEDAAPGRARNVPCVTCFSDP